VLETINGWSLYVRRQVRACSGKENRMGGCPVCEREKVVHFLRGGINMTSLFVVYKYNRPSVCSSCFIVILIWLNEIYKERKS